MMFSRSRNPLIAARWMCLQNVQINSLFCLRDVNIISFQLSLSTVKNIKFLVPDLSFLTFSAPLLRFCNQKKIPIVYYDEIKDLPNHPEKLLIDVRDPYEVRLGKIPLSINIPLCELRNELTMNGCDPEVFRKKFGRAKPCPDTYIIMYCRTGRRAAAAAEIATILGYKNVHNYCGSWLDYVRNETCD